MARSIFNPGGLPAAGDGVTNYQAVVTRELPLWKVTLTGGDLPESGHVMTSMSYARLQDDVQDWLEWRWDHNGATPHYGPVAPDQDEGASVGGSADGEGFNVSYDLHWSPAAKDAERRYWAARKVMAEARAAMTESIVTIRRELRADAEDVARIVSMPARKVHRIMLLHEREEAARMFREQRASSA
jgi:hypothetical protein